MAGESETPVLIVDDVPLMVAVVRGTLQQIGITDIDEAADGESALALIRSRRYALVLADLNMLPMNGLELLRHLRADENLRETPFLLMSTKEHTDRLIRGRQAGANGCLVKPFKVSALKKTIDAIGTLGNGSRTLL